MAYLDTQPLSRRIATLGTAGAIELAIGVALIAGLSTTIVRPDEAPQITARNIPDDLPPPPDPQPQAQQDRTVIEVPTPPDELDLTDDTVVAELDDGVIDDVVIDFPPQPPRETSTPRFPPRSAAPANDSSRWVTTDDYPRRDLIAGNQGTTRFRLIVGSNGRVQECELLRSSGSASLDRAACDNVKRRARFDAATDESGAKVVGEYTSSVKWQIPR